MDMICFYTCKKYYKYWILPGQREKIDFSFPQHRWNCHIQCLSMLSKTRTSPVRQLFMNTRNSLTCALPLISAVQKKLTTLNHPCRRPEHLSQNDIGEQSLWAAGLYLLYLLCTSCIYPVWVPALLCLPCIGPALLLINKPSALY